MFPKWKEWITYHFARGYIDKRKKVYEKCEMKSHFWIQETMIIILKKYDAFCTTLFGMQEDSSTV